MTYKEENTLIPATVEISSFEYQIYDNEFSNNRKVVGVHKSCTARFLGGLSPKYPNPDFLHIHRYRVTETTLQLFNHEMKMIRSYGLANIVFIDDCTDESFKLKFAPEFSCKE